MTVLTPAARIPGVTKPIVRFQDLTLVIVYSHPRMSLKTGREVGGSGVSFLVIFGSFGADQREARRAPSLMLVFPS